MNSVGMGGFVSQKGWLELGSVGSHKIKISQFNLNNTAKSGKVTDGEGEGEMKDVAEFILAIRTLRTAAQFACNWNLSYVALENFFHQKEFCKEDLRYTDNPARVLCQFTDFAMSENANRYRDGSGFLTTGELATYWAAFIGARPNIRSAPASTSGSKQKTTSQETSRSAGASKKRKWPFSDICNKYNTGQCQKAPGTCINFRGQHMRHVCNWRDLHVPNSQPCGQPHMRVGNH